MGKFEKGRTKTGGRQKGTKNKLRPVVREKLLEITNTPEFWEKFCTELMNLEGRDFTHAAKDIFDITEPKLQAIAADFTTEASRSTILDRLDELSQQVEK